MGRKQLGVAVVLLVLAGATWNGAVQSVAAGNAGLHVTKTVDGINITPLLSITLAADRTNAIPADAIKYSAQLQNIGSTFEVDGTFTAEATASTQAQLAYYWDEIDYCAKGCGNGDGNGHWLPLVAFVNVANGYDPIEPPPTNSGLDLSVSSVSAPGVIYPPSGDQILGTVINPKATARWTYSGKVALSPGQIGLLSDPTQVQEIRNVVHFEVTPRDQNAAQPFDDREVFADPFESHADPGAITNISVTFNQPDGTTQTVGATVVPGLASLKPGQTLTVPATFKVPVISAKGSSEMDDAYFARLSAADGAQLTALATASGMGFGGVAITATSNVINTTESVPIVTIKKSGPTQLDAGTLETNSLTLQNRGSAGAVGLSVTDSLPGGATGTVTGVPISIAAGASNTAQATYQVPASQPPGGLTDTAAVSWRDGNSNAYGPVSSSFTTVVNNNTLLGARVKLGPTGPNNDVTGTSQSLSAVLVDRNGKPIPGKPIAITTMGANSASAGGSTDSAGGFSMSYVGANAGADTARATVTAGSFKIYSNPVIIGWLTPPASGVTTIVDGNFFTEPTTATTFVAKPTDTPAFKESFPNINFNPPSGFPPHVWFYMQSTGRLHDLSTYSDLPTYTTTPAGLELWEPASAQPPLVAYNPTSQTIAVSGINIPAGKLDVHPGAGSMVIVAWRSPITDRIAVTGGVSSLDSHGAEGVAWTIDQGATTLASGSYIGKSGQTFAAGAGGSSLTNLSVRAGDTLYFTLAPNPTNGFDSTELDISINSAAGATWDVARDFHSPNNEVDPLSVPFTDVTTSTTGTLTGTIPAEGNGKQAGVGPMTAFDADLTGQYLAAAAGDVTFNFYVGDGFIFGLGNGATRVSGVYENLPQPSTTPFKGYQVVGAFNRIDSGGPNNRSITVHFPSAGTYPFEIDYFSAGSDRTLVLTVAQQVKDTTPFSVHVAYADGARPAGSIFPFPWLGSPNVVFVGCTASNCLYDAGAVRVDNNTSSTQTINSLTVDFGGCHYDIWPKNTVLPPGNLAIFTEMMTAGTGTQGCDNLSGTFDTSDIPETCSPTGIIPQINLAIDGVNYTYADSGQVLNTKGIDPPLCGLGNESESWSRIGGLGTPINVPLPPAVSLTLVPQLPGAAVIGDTQRIRLTVLDTRQQPVAGLISSVKVFGSNPRSLEGVTDTQGQLSVSYTGSNEGIDTISAAAFIAGFRTISNTTIVNWSAPPAPTNTGAQPPSLANLSPTNGAIITLPTPVTASINVPAGISLAQYSLELKPTGVGQPIVVASGRGVPPAPIGIIDPAAIPSGAYQLGLTAVSASGGSATLTNDIIVQPVIGPPAPSATGALPPNISNLSPGNGGVIASATPVTALIDLMGANALSYLVTLQSVTGGNPISLASGDVSPPSPLATIDPSLINPGDYILSAVVVTTAGMSSTSNSVLVTASANKQTAPSPSLSITPPPVVAAGQPINLSASITNQSFTSCGISPLALRITSVAFNGQTEVATGGDFTTDVPDATLADSFVVVAPGAAVNASVVGQNDEITPTDTFLESINWSTGQTQQWPTGAAGVYTIGLAYDPSVVPSVGSLACAGAVETTVVATVSAAASPALQISRETIITLDQVPGSEIVVKDPGLLGPFNMCAQRFAFRIVIVFPFDPANVWFDLTINLYPSYPITIKPRSAWDKLHPGKHLNANATTWTPKSSIIYWDPTDVSLLEPFVLRDACAQLYHELAHVRNHLDDRFLNGTDTIYDDCIDVYGNNLKPLDIDEAYATMNENLYRLSSGLPPRSYYWPYPLPDHLTNDCGNAMIPGR